MRHPMQLAVCILLLCIGSVWAQEPAQPEPAKAGATTPVEPAPPIGGEAQPGDDPAPIADDQGKAVPDEWSVMKYLPEDTVIAVSVKDVAKARKAFEKTGLYRLASSPELTDAVRGPMLLAKGALMMAELKHGYKLKDILNSFQGEVSMAFMGFQDRIDEHGKKMPNLLFSFQPRGQVGNTQKIIDKLLLQLNALAQGQLQVQQSNFAGAKINTLSVPNNPLRICYTLHNGNFLFTLNPAQLESILSRYHDATAGKPVKGLGASPAYQRASAKVGDEADALFYFNLDAGRNIPEMEMQPRNERKARELRATGVDQIRALAYSVAFEGEDIHESLFIDCPAENRRGIMALLDNDPIPATALASMPKNAIFASAWKTDPLKLLDRLTDLVGIGNPGDAELIQHEINKVNEKYNIDFRQDLLAAFDGQLLFSLAFPSKHPKLGFGFPLPILRMGVKDTAAAEKALEIIQQMGKDAFNYSEIAAGEQTIVAARVKKQKRDDPGQICWTLSGKEILMSIYPLALRNELQRMAGATDQPGTQAPVNNLTMDPQFQSVRGRLGKNHRMLMYMDVSAIATVFYDTYVPMAQLNPRMAPPHVDLNNLPTADFLTRNLGGLVVGVNTDEEGLLLESCSSTGLMTTITPMAALGGYMANRHRRARRQAAVAEAPEHAETRQVLREVSTRLLAYAQDHDGAFPKQLADLVPNYATEDELAHTTGFQYMGKQQAPNRVVVHSQNKEGHVMILMQDGRVRTIEAGRLAETLERGYTAPPAPKPAGDKPPLPPPDF